MKTGTKLTPKQREILLDSAYVTTEVIFTKEDLKTFPHQEEYLWIPAVIAVMSFTSRLTQELERVSPRSVAEEMILWRILNQAAAFCELYEEDDEWIEEMRDLCFEDHDFLMLFDPKMDGFYEEEGAEQMGYANLREQDWFRAFRPEIAPVHPMLDDWYRLDRDTDELTYDMPEYEG